MELEEQRALAILVGEVIVLAGGSRHRRVIGLVLVADVRLFLGQQLVE